MKKLLLIASAVLLCISASAQSERNVQFYGFIRNYAFMDTKSIIAGVENVFSYVPKDETGTNVMFNYTAMASRLGFDVSGSEHNGFKFGAKVEADFYNGNGAAVLSLRQAYLTVSKGSETLKVGQAWHTMAADIPDVISLNTGAPFGAFSRTPMAQLDSKFSDNWSNTFALSWQQQFPSCGPEGASTNYVKYCGIPEVYLGINYTNGPVLARIGVNETFIKPVKNGRILNETMLFAYAQYKKGKLTVKAKSMFGEDGSQWNLYGGYAVKQSESFVKEDASTWTFSPTRNSSSWLYASYGQKIKGALYVGYTKNFGTSEKVYEDMYYFCKNGASNILSAARFSPEVTFNLGKLSLTLTYEQTAALYGSKDSFNADKGLYDTGRHVATNHRVMTTLNYSF